MRTGLVSSIRAVIAGFLAASATAALAQAGNMPGWDGPAVQAPASQQQPRWATTPERTANRPQVTATRARPGASPFRTWEQLWGAVWSRARSIPIQTAATVRNHSVCRGDISDRIGTLAVQTARAINAGRDGDAARFLARFQDKLMCLNVKSMWGMDLTMAAFLAKATQLPARQRDQAMKGFLNMALLVFDQIQYTGRSYSLPVLYHTRGHVQRVLAGYSGQELGLWFYDYQSGAMQRHTFDQKNSQFRDGLLGMVSRPGRFAQGACSTTAMVGHGFRCRGIRGGRARGWAGRMHATSGGRLACMTAAASAGGMQGQLRCMARAGGGGGSIGSWMARAKPSLNIRGVLDGFCSGATSEPPKLDEYEENPVEHSEAKKKGWWASFMDSLDIMETGGSDSSRGGSGSAGRSQGGLREWTEADTESFLQENREREARARAMEQKKNYKLDEFKWQPGRDSSMSEDSSGCGDPTNAVARANRLFNCTGMGGGRPGSGGSTGPLVGQNAPGTRSIPQPGSAGGAGGMSGLMSCAMQGGSLVRTSMNDRRCQQSMCAPGQDCACNGGGGSASPEVQGQVQRSVFSPNRPNIGARDPRPDSGVGGVPRWGGAGGPAADPLGGKGPGGER